MNTNDPIEEMFRDNQHGFDEKPRDLIWDRIEDRLDEKAVQKKKIQWWKYATAACVVLGMAIGVWSLLNNPNPVSKLENSTQIVYEVPVEINDENASEILDKLEENQQSIVIRDEKKLAPEIFESEFENEPQRLELKLPEALEPEPVYDVGFIEEISAAPAMAKEKVSEEGERVANLSKKERSTALRTESRIDSFKQEDTRRLGNSYFVPERDSLKTNFYSIDISLKEKMIRYNLVSRSDSIYVFENAEIVYPKQIIFRKMKDSISIIYSGKNSKRNSKESKEIQEFIEENIQGIQSQFWDN